MVISLVLIVITGVLFSCIKVVPQTQNYIIERLGVYRAVWTPGLHILFPVIDRVAGKVDMKEWLLEIPLQPVITKDSKTVRIKMDAYLQVVDPRLFTYAIGNDVRAVEQLTTATLRNVVGELGLEETLTSREMIQMKMLFALQEATRPWGIKFHRIELQNVLPSA